MSQTEEFSKGEPDKIPDLPVDWADDEGPSSARLESPNDPPAQTLYLVGSAFFLSGLAALTYEVVWQRVLVRVIGATTPAVATIICAFMIGLAIGGFVGAELAKKRGNQLVVLAVLELLIGVLALLSVLVCQNNVIVMLTGVLGATVNSATVTSLIGFLTVFALIAIPTSLMGATLPIVAGFFARSPRRGVLLTRFYAINSAGAVFGAFMSGFFLLPMLGISGSLIFAAGLNLLSSSLAFLASRSVQVSQFSAAFLPSDISRNLGEKKIASGTSSQYSETYFNAGLALGTSALSFTMQIVWTRFFVFLFGSSTHALSLVLSIYIAGLALGAWFISRDRVPRNDLRNYSTIAVLLAFTSLAMASVLHQFQMTPVGFLYVKKFLIEHIGSGFWCDSLAMLLIAIPLTLLPSLLAGMVFPLLLNVEGNAAIADQSATSGESLPKRTAILYSASLLGSIVSTAYSFTLLPVVAKSFTSGLEMTTLLTSILFALATLIVIVKQLGKQLGHYPKSMFMNEFGRFFIRLIQLDFRNTRNGKKLTPYVFAVNTLAVCLLTLSLTLALLMCRPKWDAMLISAGLSNVSADDIKAISVPELARALQSDQAGSQLSQTLVMYREGLNSTVSVVKKPSANLTYLRNNGKVEAAIPTDPFFPAPESDLPTQTLLGLIPALHCSGDSLDGLVIGFGSGTTCSAIVPATWVKHLTAVELEEAVWDARSHFATVFADSKGVDPLQQKLTPVIADARNYLSLHDRQFDFIVSQPAEPWLSGASDLYTVEFYQLVKKRLKGTGLFCQWVPLYSLTPAQLRCLVQTFQHVFPQTTIWHPKRAGELILAGQVGEKIRPSVVENRLQADAVSLQLQKIGIENQFELYRNAIQLPSSINQSLEDIVLNTDDNLLIESKLARDMNSSSQNIDENFRRVFGDENNFKYAMLPDPSEGNALERDLALVEQNTHSQRYATDDIFLYAVCDHDLEPSDEPPRAPPRDLSRPEQVRFFLRTGNPRKAAQILKSLDTSAINDYAALSDFGTVYFLTGDYNTALSFFRKAETKVSTSHSQANAGIGLCLWMLGESQQAVKPLTISLAHDPNQFLARYALGHTLMNSGRELDAMINMRAAALVNPASAWPGIFVTAGNIQQGDWKSADANLQLVLRRKASMPEAIALGCLISMKTNQRKDYLDYKNRYRAITASDITDSELESLVKSILSSPHIITKI